MNLRLLVLTLAGLLIAARSNATACVPPPPVSSEITAKLGLEAQRDFWRHSTSVFLARSENLQSNSPQIGNRAELIPLLQLKGPTLNRTVPISHTAMSSCGPYPFLNALADEPGSIFIVFSNSEQPAADSVTNTMRPSFLSDPVILQAWKVAYDAFVERRNP